MNNNQHKNKKEKLPLKASHDDEKQRPQSEPEDDEVSGKAKELLEYEIEQVEQQLHSMHLSTISSTGKFNLELVCTSFSLSIKDKSEICMLMYLEAFGELNKYVQMSKYFH